MHSPLLRDITHMSRNPTTSVNRKGSITSAFLDSYIGFLGLVSVVTKVTGRLILLDFRGRLTAVGLVLQLYGGRFHFIELPTALTSTTLLPSLLALYDDSPLDRCQTTSNEPVRRL